MNIRLITRCFILLCAVAITGCGFELRGSANKPGHLNNVYISGSGKYSNFIRDLKAKLISQGINVTESAQSADLTLMVTGNNSERRVLTITRSDRVEEYQLINTVTFKINTPGGSEVVPEKKIVVERVYEYDRTQVIGTEYEQDLYEKEMNADTINQVITRLYAVTEEDIANAKTVTSDEAK